MSDGYVLSTKAARSIPIHWNTLHGWARDGFIGSAIIDGRLWVSKRELEPLFGTVRHSDAARALGVSSETLETLRREGRVSAVRTPGGQKRYKREDLRALRRWMGDLVPRRDVANSFGVGEQALKRWEDDGTLEKIFTRGMLFYSRENIDLLSE